MLLINRSNNTSMNTTSTTNTNTEEISPSVSLKDDDGHDPLQPQPPPQTLDQLTDDDNHQQISELPPKKSKLFSGFFKKLPIISASSSANTTNSHNNSNIPSNNGSIVTSTVDLMSTNTNTNTTTSKPPPSIIDDLNHITIIQSKDGDEDEDDELLDNDDLASQPLSTPEYSDGMDRLSIPNSHSRNAHLHGNNSNINNNNSNTTSTTNHINNIANSNNYGALVNDHERYTSFTAECISLQNSEMTSYFENESYVDQPPAMNRNDSVIHHQVEQHPVHTHVLPPSQAPPPSSQVAPPSLAAPPPSTATAPTPAPLSTAPAPPQKRNLRNLLRIASFSGINNIHSNNPHNGTAETSQQQYQHPSNHQHYPHSNRQSPEQLETINDNDSASNNLITDNQFQFDEVQDLTAYLSDSESDLNFDPKNEENEFDYKVGGYHPVSKGEIYYSKNFPNREYIILRKLGWGHFSTVWLAKSRFNPNLNIIDSDSSPDEELVDTSEYYVAIKFVKSNKNYLEAAEDEIKILKALHDPINFSHLSSHDKEFWQHIKPTAHPGYKHIMKLLDNFQIVGPNGNHICMVFEILGENVLNLIYKYKQFYSTLNHEIIVKQDHESKSKSKSKSQSKSKSKSKSKCESQEDGISTRATTINTNTNTTPPPHHPISKQSLAMSTPTGSTADTNTNGAIAGVVASSNSNTSANNMKFSKWDTKYLKKNTKSMLSLGLTKKTSSKHRNSNSPTSNTITPSVSTGEQTPQLQHAAVISSSASSIVSNDNEHEVGDEAHVHKHKDSTTSTSTSVAGDENFDKKLKNLNSDSLLRLLKKSRYSGGIPLNLVRQIVKQLFLALDYMHHSGIIHTDLKPENILIEIKEINKLIKIIELEKVSKLSSTMNPTASTNTNASTATSHSAKQPGFIALFSRKGSSNSVKKRQPTSTSLSNSRNHSIASVNSVNSFHYKKSKNSVSNSTIGGTPIRSSKPLSSSMSQEVFFKDIDYEDHEQDHTPVFSNLNPDSTPRPSVTKISPRTHNISNANNAISLLNQKPVVGNGAVSLTSMREEEEEGQGEEADGEPDISIKIADLGNATFTNLHFTNQIQTRQYRSPEILLKYKSWGSSTDLWSVGCIIFELITGDYLFDPHDGQYFDKDEDHLAQIIELLGEFPSDEYLLDCKLTSKFFKLNPINNEIIFKNIYNLKYWGLQDVLIEKYKFKKDDIQVKLISDLILKCLRFSLSDRYDAGSLLNHPWLQDDLKFDELSYDDETIDTWLKNMDNNNQHLPGFTNLSK